MPPRFQFIVFLACVACASHPFQLFAQTPQPIPLPSASSTSPLDPHPLPPSEPPVFVTPPPFPTFPPLAPTTPPVQGPLPTGADMAAYQQARTPSASVALAPSSPTKTPSTQSFGQPAAPDAVTVQASGGAFGLIPLGSSATPLSVSRHSHQNSAASSQGNGGVSVSLQFDSARASSPVWIQTLDGGSFQTTDENGQPQTIIGGLGIPIGADGKVSFVFVPPAADGRYQVLIKLDDVTNIMPFMVGNPQAD